MLYAVFNKEVIGLSNKNTLVQKGTYIVYAPGVVYVCNSLISKPYTSQRFKDKPEQQGH